jgi:hypothetical protein
LAKGAGRCVARWKPAGAVECGLSMAQPLRLCAPGRNRETAHQDCQNPREAR